MIWRVWDCGDEICGTLFFIFPARRECKKIDSFVGNKQNFVEYLKKKYGGTGKTIKLVYEVLPNSVGEETIQGVGECEKGSV